MKKLLCILLLGPLLLSAQNVVTKRKAVFIDDVKVGKVIEAANRLNHSKFVYSDLEGNMRLSFEYTAVPSLLEGFDEAYYYTSIRIPEFGIEAYCDTKDFVVTRRNLVHYFVKEGLIMSDGKINPEKALTYKDIPRIPLEIVDKLEEERAQQESQDFILERDLNKPISLKLVDSKQLDLKHIRIPLFTSYIIDDYEVFQGEQPLGKIVARYYVQVDDDNPSSDELIKSGNPDIYFINSKGGRVAYINSFPARFRVHEGNLEFNQFKMFFLKEKEPTKKMETAVQWLIYNGKL